MLIDAVVFDLDGTLLDHAGSVRTALTRWLPALGRTVTDPFVEAWLAAEQRHYPAWRAGEISFVEQRRRRLRDVLPLLDHPVGTDDELDAVFQGYLTEYERSWTAFSDVVPTVQRLAELRLATAVLTNGTEQQQNAKLRRTGLAGRVGPVLTAEALGAAKPDPRTYLAACTRLGTEPGRTLHVGDLHDLDVVAARVAGLLAVHLDRTDEGPHDEPCRIDTLAELPALIAASGTDAARDR